MIGLPRSTFYYRPTEPEQAIGDDDVVEKIREIQGEFAGYGKRRVTQELHRRGFKVNHKRVERLMRAHGLGIKPKRSFVRTTDSDHPYPIYPNLYNNVIPAKPNVVWVADITYIRLLSGFAYLAAILDACSRKVVGYAISTRIDSQLTLAALKAALDSRKPQPGACIHHSDRGVQYASNAYREALEANGLIGSMSAVGNPYDNPQAESFMKTIKVEEIYIGGYETYADLVERLPRFIDNIYNTKRLHSALGYKPPQEFEDHLTRAAA